MPTQERLWELFDYDPQTGSLTYKLKRPHCQPGVETGSIMGNGYRLCGVGNRKYLLAHRIIWVMVKGSIPDDMQIDHINGDPLDNRITNLRLVTSTGNQRNLRCPSHNKSGVVGVCWDNCAKRWLVNITLKNKLRYIGRFINFDDAVRARKEAEAMHNFHPNHGRNGKINLDVLSA